MINNMRAAIFDLDGVIVDTAKYHYLAWKRLAQEYGFDICVNDNERLKGVSRLRSLDILLEIGGLRVDDATKQTMASKKNEWYVDYIHQLSEAEVLPGAKDYLRVIRQKGVRTAIGSASKNASLILEKLHIQSLFDVVIDGTKVQETKPDPQVFLLAAKELHLLPENCVVFEDAEAGIEAARRAGMGTVGIGSPLALQHADIVIPGLNCLMLIMAA
jgi:beta-phosphoglucomutase